MQVEESSVKGRNLVDQQGVARWRPRGKVLEGLMVREGKGYSDEGTSKQVNMRQEIRGRKKGPLPARRERYVRSSTPWYGIGSIVTRE